MYSLVSEAFILSVEEQKQLPISEWQDYYKVAIKKHKQKNEVMSLNHS